ncbi:MAG: hypothetical protein WCJ30_25180 [Deltaproteobacteria bacterium]
MERTYAPRTVAFVALASLVLGFVVVFGGGLLLMRPKARARTAATTTASASTAGGFADDASSGPVPDAGSLAGPVDETPGAGGETPADDAGGVAAPSGPAPEPTQSAGITIGPASVSRCFNAGPPTPIRGADCDRLVELDSHVASRATQIAACARSGAHGRLGLVLDFRFSTSYANGWGSPTSNIANPGNVAACVKLAILPLPFANIRHLHDRYLVIVPIDW